MQLYAWDRHGNIGDHAGSDAAVRICKRFKFRPDMSIENSAGWPLAPALSRVNISTLPFGAQVGPSSRNEAVRSRS